LRRRAPGGGEADLRPRQQADQPLRQGGAQTMTMMIGDALGMLLKEELPGRFTAYDGSSVGTGEVDITLRLKNRRGLAYLLTAPGDLGLARAYVMGDLDIEGVHPGDPYDAL